MKNLSIYLIWKMLYLKYRLIFFCAILKSERTYLKGISKSRNGHLADGYRRWIIRNNGRSWRVVEKVSNPGGALRASENQRPPENVSLLSVGFCVSVSPKLGPLPPSFITRDNSIGQINGNQMTAPFKLILF